MLTPAEETFCRAYVESRDACESYRHALLVPGLAGRTTAREAQRLLERAAVQDRIAEIHDEPASAARSYDRSGGADRGLWCAVILRAIEDARGEGLMGPVQDRMRVQEAALTWLTRPSRDLFFVCEMAGLEPHAVMAHARSIVTCVAA